MAYRIVFKSSIKRDLKRMTKVDARRLLDRVEKDLPKQANACPQLEGEFAGLRRLRLGDYRVIFAIVEEDIIVLRISHRKDAYK